MISYETIPIDTRVMVVAHLSTSKIAIAKQRYIGHTGRVARYNGLEGYYMRLEFDDKELNKNASNWLWRNEEVIILDKDNLNFVR